MCVRLIRPLLSLRKQQKKKSICGLHGIQKGEKRQTERKKQANVFYHLLVPLVLKRSLGFWEVLLQQGPCE